MKLVKLVTAVAMVAIAGSAYAQASYSITDLGTLGGRESAAYGLNDLGQVVGYSRTASGGIHAFLYSNGAMTDLGVLGRYASGAPDYSVARDINNSGQVVGLSSAGTATRAFIYQNGALTDLGGITAGRDSAAYAINNAGLAVGESFWNMYYLGPSSTHAALFNGTSTQDLGTYTYQTIDSRSTAYDINSNGAIVGSVSNGNNLTAFLYQNSNWTDVGALLGLGNVYSFANGINDSGMIIGSYQGSSGMGSFIYDNGSFTTTGTFGGLHSQVHGLNDLGQVVGSASTTTNDPHAFLFEDGGLTDINTLIDPNLGWTLSEAMDINNHGQIVGWGTVNGMSRAFLLTPNETVSAVPAPPAFILMLTGLGLLGLTRRGKNAKT